MDIPKKGENITITDLMELSLKHGRKDLAEKLFAFDPKKKFKSDGCSGGFPDEIKGVCIYEECFWHDVEYFIGGTQADKLRADGRLMLGVLDKTGNPDLALLMFNGVWAGGYLPAPWRWGFGA